MSNVTQQIIDKATGNDADYKIARERLMYGETVAEMIEAYGNSMTDIVDLTMYAQSILSDAQEVMARGNTEQARQFINKAKFFISESRKVARSEGL